MQVEYLLSEPWWLNGPSFMPSTPEKSLINQALAVIEYLVAHGSERAVDEIIEHTFQISVRTLRFCILAHAIVYSVKNDVECFLTFNLVLCS